MAKKTTRIFLSCICALLVSVTGVVPTKAANKPVVSVSITTAQAKTIALTHANVSASDASFSKLKLDDGVYELKFSTTVGNKYEYEISAVTGAILDYDHDIKNSSSKPNTPDTPDSDSSSVGQITALQAKQIAVEHAGISLTSTKYINAYISWKNHAPYAYEVEFALRNNTQYHYTINLYSGSIITHYVERY